MDFKQYLKEEEERVDEILPSFVLGAAKVAGGIGSTIARGIGGAAKAVGGAAARGIGGAAKVVGAKAKQTGAKVIKRTVANKAGEVAQNTLAPEREDASHMYITKAGVKFISEKKNTKKTEGAVVKYVRAKFDPRSKSSREKVGAATELIVKNTSTDPKKLDVGYGPGRPIKK